MKEEGLILIPKAENYIEYMLEVIVKLPRTEKFNIGNEFKNSMYQMLEEILYLHKNKKEAEEILTRIDTKLLLQRIYLRILLRHKWINEHKFKVAMEKIEEIGKIIGGLLKYYGKNNTKGMEKSSNV